MLHELMGVSWNVEYGPPRPGDVRDSIADTRKARDAFGFSSRVSLEEGLTEYIEWAKTVIDE
jgi:UDP-glucose 4-epimerase